MNLFSRHIYWTDWGLHSRIEKANMDGGNRHKIVDTGLGAWPNGMAIDILGGWRLRFYNVYTIYNVNVFPRSFQVKCSPLTLNCG